MNETFWWAVIIVDNVVVVIVRVAGVNATGYLSMCPCNNLSCSKFRRDR